MKSANIRACIIDDDDGHIITIKEILSQNFPNISVVSTATSVAQGIEAINTSMPDLLFLDIFLPDGKGFDILAKTLYKNYEIIFITSHNEFAVNAFELAALHYLIKPITKDKLQDALDRFHKNKTSDNYENKLKILQESLADSPESILIQTGTGMTMVIIADIVRLESEASYTKIVLNNNNCIISTKNLRKFESILLPLNFVRTHNSHIINIRYVKKYMKGRCPSIVMNDNTEIPISITKKDEFLEKLNGFAWTI